jgi:hypothetical protein
MRHPITLLADRIGKGSTVIVLATVAVVSVSITPEESLLATGVLAALVLAGVTSSRFLDGEGRSELDVATDLYVEGEISLAEFDRRAELILDDRAAEIRESVEQVSGVGPATSASIAIEYESLDAVEVAPAEELEQIHGVGPSTAGAIRDYYAVDAVRSTSTSTSTATDGGTDR